MTTKQNIPALVAVLAETLVKAQGDLRALDEQTRIDARRIAQLEAVLRKVEAAACVAYEVAHTAADGARFGQIRRLALDALDT